MNITITPEKEDPFKSQIKVTSPYVKVHTLLDRFPTLGYHRLESIEAKPFQEQVNDLVFEAKSHKFSLVLESKTNLESYSLENNDGKPGELVVDNRTGDRDISWLTFKNCKPGMEYKITLSKSNSSKVASARFSVIHW